VISDFFKYSFTTWFNSTIGGLSFGAVIFIIILWQDALRREQKLREENLIFQNETLKNQVNPHFLFNSLNTLSSLIDTQPDTSRIFIGRLSSIYRYILDNCHKDKVPLRSELAFVSDYFDLHKIRDEEKIVLTINVRDAEQFWILPVSLQILLENAIKHNMATRERPLKITICLEEKYVIVRNNLQKMSVQLKSTKIGLKNLAERVRLVTGKNLIIEETANDFTVKVPLLS
jgi:LytS/YehU family sensor histidine kinase